VATAYRIFEQATNKQVFFTNIIRADEFIQKGSPVIPVGMK